LVKLTGDGFLAEFSSVLQAVTCAMSIQEALHENSLEFRMGIHLGDIIDDGKDIYGEGVNIAARIEGLAEPGGISISGGVYEQIRNRVHGVFEDMGMHELKHVSAPVRIYRVVPRETTSSTTATC
jgi:adenylate cyclase